jgi:hypothetical protein
MIVVRFPVDARGSPCLFSKTSRLAVGLSEAPTGESDPRPKADHSSASSVEVTNEWIYSSTLHMHSSCKHGQFYVFVVYRSKKININKVDN